MAASETSPQRSFHRRSPRLDAQVGDCSIAWSHSAVSRACNARVSLLEALLSAPWTNPMNTQAQNSVTASKRDRFIAAKATHRTDPRHEDFGLKCEVETTDDT